MAWIRRAPSGHWQVRYRDPEGAEKVETFRLKGDARSRAAEVEASKLAGRYRDPRAGRASLASFWRAWRARAGASGHPSERTLISYDELWRLYIEPALGSKRLNAITRADVEQLVASVGAKSAWRAADVLKVTRMILGRAVAAELIATNPAARVTPPRIEISEPRVLTPEELSRLVDAMPERWRAFVLLAGYSSLRFSELVALRVDRLDLPRRRIRVEAKITEAGGRLIEGEPKTRQSRRSVAIPEFVAFELAEHLRKYPAGPSGLVFTMPGGGPVRRQAFYRRVWKPATALAKLEGFKVGQLRHTGASLAIAAGANPLLVAARLGHTNTRMVERHYASLFEGLDREIARNLEEMHRRRASESRRLRPSS